MPAVFLGPDNIVSPLGVSTEENFFELLRGKSALQSHPLPFNGSPFYCSIIAEDLIEKNIPDTLSTKLTKLEKMSFISISNVIESSGLDLKDKKNLLLISTTKGNIDVLEGTSHIKDPSRAYLTELGKILEKELHCANKPLVLSNACISGLLAIIIGKKLIENGKYENVLVCGADLVTEFTLSGFRSFNALSSEPCRPFDADRKGINLGEAAATILLSSKIKSDVIIRSGASANDANHISGPSREGSGLFQAISETLDDQPRPDFISAHGTATEYNDEMESVAFSRAKISDLPVHSLKGYYGHTLGAAGVLESIIALQCLRKNILLKSQGYYSQGTSHLHNVVTDTTENKTEHCLKTASGFGGCNAAALFSKVKT